MCFACTISWGSYKIHFVSLDSTKAIIVHYYCRYAHLSYFRLTYSLENNFKFILPDYSLFPFLSRFNFMALQPQGL